MTDEKRRQVILDAFTDYDGPGADPAVEALDDLLAALDRLVAERDALLSIHDKKRDAGRGGSTHWATCHLSHLDCANLKRELAEKERNRLRELLGRIRQWDHLYGAEDGPYWQREIDTALEDSDD